MKRSMKVLTRVAGSVFLIAVVLKYGFLDNYTAEFMTTVIGPSELVQSQEGQLRTFSFSTANLTADSYSQVIKRLRDALAARRDRHGGMPVLRDPATVTRNSLDRFLGLEISTSTKSITVAVDVTDLSVHAYQGKDRAYFLRDDDHHRQHALSPLFRHSNKRIQLPFGNDYSSLAQAANRSVRDIPLGMHELKAAITKLHGAYSGSASRAESIVVLNQMIFEAARFVSIENMVMASMRAEEGGRSGVFLQDEGMLGLAQRWEDLSCSIQESVNGTFQAITLNNHHGQDLEVSNLRPVLTNTMRIMKFCCEDPSRVAPQFFMPTGSVKTCAYREPTVRIGGLNGLCLDAEGERFYGRNVVVLRPCASQISMNQLWTLKRDGTIRSRGKCLSTNGYGRGRSYVIIQDCTTTDTLAIRWEVCENGTITHVHSRQVLTADPSSNGGSVKVIIDRNMGDSHQSWLPSNNTEPFMASIVHSNGLCLKADGSRGWLEECVGDRQRWAFYPDGSIRVADKHDICLGRYGEYLFITTCNFRSGLTRWLLRKNGTIMSFYDGLVIDVKGSDPIIVLPYTGNPNQLWYLQF